MAFKLFEEYGSASRDHATLRASGAVFLPNAVLKMVDADKPQSAKLYFDEESKRLGVQLLEKHPSNDKTARKLNTEGSGVAVSVQPIMRYYGLTQPSKKLDMSVTEDDGMLTLDFSSLTPGRRGRRPKAV